MSKHCFFALAACCCPALLLAQPTFQQAIELPGQKWSHGHSVAAFDPTRVYVGGFRYVSSERQRAVLSAFGADGTFQWAKTYSTGVYNEQLEWIEQNPDGSLMLLMDRASASGTKIGVVKTTSAGQVMWSKTYSKSGDTGIRMLRVADGYVLCGSEYINGAPEALLALKIDFDGQIMWAKSLSPPGITNAFHSMAEGADGSVYLSGNYDYSGGDAKNILVKLAADGTFLWAKNYQTAFADGIFRDLVTLGDGTVVVGGLARTAPFILDGWVLHLDPQGSVLASHSISQDSMGSYLDISNLVRSPDDQVVMTLGPGILAKTNGDAVTEWAYKYGREMVNAPYPLFLFQVRNVPGGGFVATGAYEPPDFAQKSRIVLLKTDEQGRVADCCLSKVHIKRTVFPATPQDVVLLPQGVSPVENYVLNVEDIVPNVTSTCEPANPDLRFTLSDSVICPLECVTADLANPTPGFEFSFVAMPGAEPGHAQPNELCFPKAGEYQIQVRALKVGCIDTTAAQPLKVRSIKDQFPNAFTPNGDDVNDVYRPIYYCPVVATDFRVYNRWGQLVFQTTDPDQGWDGMVQGQPAPADVYVWRVEYDALRENGRQRFSENGELTLLR